MTDSADLTLGRDPAGAPPSQGIVLVNWSSPDPATLAARFSERLGFRVERVPLPVATGSARWWVEFPSGRLEFGRLDSPATLASGFASLTDDRIISIGLDVPAAGRTTFAASYGERAHPNGVTDLLAVGWATVDADRAATGFPDLPFASPAVEPLLGAQARYTHYGRAGLVLLEPTTEGKLAATLARRSEGPAVVYLRIGLGRLDAFLAQLERRAEPVSAPIEGPFGRSVRVGAGPAWGPHLIVCEAPASGDVSAGTIQP